MLRLFIALGSLVFEIATMATEGALAATMIVAGTIVTAIHITTESFTFQSVVNRLTGFDLPECLGAHPPGPPPKVKEMESRSGENR